MTILYPDRRVGGVPIEGATVQPRCDIPLPQISGAVGERDYALLPAPAPPPCGQPAGIIHRHQLWDVAQKLWQILRRTTERRQFYSRLVQRAVQQECAQIGGFRLVGPALQLQHVAEMKVWVSGGGILSDCAAIGGFGGHMAAAFLQRVAKLYPDRRCVRIAGERGLVVVGGDIPLPGVAGTVGKDDRVRLPESSTES